MVPLTRRLARRLRVVYRRSALGLPPLGPVPPLVLRAAEGRLRVEHRHAGLAVICERPAPPGPAEVFALPTDALLEVEGPDDTPVLLDGLPGRTRVRWEVGGVPQARVYEVPAVAGPAAPARVPALLAPAPPGFPAALAEGAALAWGADGDASPPPSPSPSRCPGWVWLCGGTGALVARGGGQVLVQSAFEFPWCDDVAIRPAPLWRIAGGRLTARPWLVGRAAGLLAIRAGCWTVLQEIPAGVPPAPGDPARSAGPDLAGRLRLDPADRRILGRALRRHDPAAGPSALDLDPRLGVTLLWPAAGACDSGVWRLGRSSYAGEPTRLVAAAGALDRGGRLGFVTFAVGRGGSFVASAVPGRSFGWSSPVPGR